MSKLILQVCTAALGLGRMLSWMRIGAPAFIYWQTRVAEGFRP